MNSHWKSWSCLFGCSITYDSALKLKTHILQSHLPSLTGTQLDAIVATGSSQTADDITVECLFCKNKVLGLRRYTRHVDNHLKQLALFTLPDPDYGSGDDSDDKNHMGVVHAGESDTSGGLWIL